MQSHSLTGCSSSAKRYKVIACKVLAREFYLCACRCPNIIDIQLMPQQLHDTPDLLHSAVQTAIDAAESEDWKYDALLLGYGLCSNGTAGLHSNHTPLVLPRAHDCATLFLGDKARYRSLFDACGGGVYWFTAGWMETSVMPGPERERRLLKEYTKRFGEDNAAYLVEMERAWSTEYKAAYYTEWPSLKNPGYTDYMKQTGALYGWKTEIVTGSDSLLHDMLAGNWDHERFLVVEPQQKIAPSFEEATIVKAVK